MNRLRSMAWMLGAVLLLTAVGCGKKSEPGSASAPVAKPEGARASTRMKLTEAELEPACAAQVPASVGAFWRKGGLEVAGGAQGNAQFAGSEGEAALVVLQNGNGEGADEVQSAEVTLNGAPAGSISAGTRLSVKRVTLGEGNFLLASATGGGRVRVSVAVMSHLPCVMANTGYVRGGGQDPAQTLQFSTHSGSLGVLVMEMQGLQPDATVLLNGVDVLAGVQGLDRLTYATAVPLGATNTLEVTSTGGLNSQVKAVVFDADTLPPSLTMYEPENGAFFTSSPVRVSGKFGVDTRSVRVNGNLASIVGQDAYWADVALVEGANALTTEIADTCGNVARVCHAVGLDSQAPVLTVSGVTEGQITQGPVTISWEETGGYVTSSSATLNGAPFQKWTTVSAEGTYELLVTAEDAEGRVAKKKVSFRILLTAPVLTITGVTEGQHAPGPVTPVYSATSPALELLQSTLDGAGYVSGTPVTAEGAHRLFVVAKDRAGNFATQAVNFTIDTTFPVVNWWSVQEGAFLNAPAVVTYGASDANLVEGAVVATLDGAPFVSGNLVSGEGAHTVEVTAKDKAGNQTVAQLHFTLDFTPPQVWLTGAPVAEAPGTQPVASEVVTLEVHATDAALKNVVTLLNWEPYVSGTPVTEDGTYFVMATATDEAGNESVASAHFILDRTPPELQVIGVEDDGKYQSPVQVSYQSWDANPKSLTATLDGQPFESGTEISAEGPHTLVVTATDRAHHTTTRTFHFLVDLTAPQLVLTGIPTPSLVNHAVTPGWTVTETNLDRVEARLDGELITLGTVVSAEGTHTLGVTAWDTAGNSASQLVTFTVDLTAPVIWISGVWTNGEWLSTPVTLTWTVDELHPGPVSATLDGAAFSSGGVVSAPGAHTLVVTAKDAAGNEKVETRTFTLDMQAPELALESPANGFATKASEVELVVVATDNGSLSSVQVAGTGMVKGADGKYRLTVPLEEGGNWFDVMAYDAAGNSKWMGFQLVRDTAAPTLVVTSPADNIFSDAASVTVEGYATDSLAVTVKVGSETVQLGVGGGSFSVQAALHAGDNTLEVVATDAAGNVSTVTRHVLRSGTPPTLVVTDPPDGYTFLEGFVTVRGEASVADPTDTPQVTVDGQAAAVSSDGRFAQTVEVPVGPKTVLVKVVDGHGQTAEKTLQLLRIASPDAGTPDAGTSTPDAGTSQDGGTSTPDAGTPGQDAGAPEVAPAPVLVVETPEDGTVVGGMRFAVTGRVEDGELPLQVTVNGLPAAVSSRHFSVSLALLEGPQTVSIQVKDALGRTASAQRSVVVDRTAPYISVTRPATNPAVVTESPYLLKGTVGDANLARVTVKGVPVTVVAGSFAVPVSLQSGDNAVEVAAEDLGGNRRVVVQHLSITNVAPVVTILEPLEGAEASGPEIDVRVKVEAGADVETVEIGTGEAAEVSPGIYGAKVALGLGENTIEVRATDVQGLSGVAQVTVRYRDVTQEALAVTGVSPAPGAAGVETDALVSVSFNKPVEEATAASHFEVRARGEKLEGGYSVAPGGQTVTFVALRALPAGERVQVKVSGMRAAAGPHQEGAYASEFTVRRPLTVVRGVVLDEHLQPLPGVKVEVEGQTGAMARTGPDGNWALLGVQGGSQVVVRYEGGTTSDGRMLPAVRRRLFVTAEAETQDRPVVLYPVEGASAQRVDGAAGGLVTFGGVHGPLKLEVAAGGLAFASGATDGFLTATELPAYARPVPMEERASAAALWQLGPEKVQFLKSVKLTLPNRTELPAGSMAVLLGFDDKRLAMKRVGFGHVTTDGTAIVSDGDVASASFEYFGYMEMTAEQQAKVAEALAQAGGTTGGSDGGVGGATDGGLGLRMNVPARPPSPWERLGELLLGKANAQFLLAGLGMGLSAMDSFPAGIAYVWGEVRAPSEDQTALTMKQPAATVLSKTMEVDLPHTQAIEFTATYESNQPVPVSGEDSQVVIATLGGTGPDGKNLAPGAGDEWLVQGENEVSLFTEVNLSPGTTHLILSGKTRYDTRAIRLKAVLEPIAPDGGVGPAKRAKLTLTKESDSSEGEEDPLHGAARFKGVKVDITSASDSAAVTGDSGKYSTLVQVPAPDTMGIACADIPLGPRFVARVDEEGNTRFDSVPGSFSTCSPTFWLYPNQSSRADVLVDVRLLHGSVTFKHKDGTKVPAVCQGATETQWDGEKGEVTALSEADVATTEVHFFRDDDLEHPLARYALTRPSPEECEDPEDPPLSPQGLYSRVRLGPTNGVARATRERCRQLAAEGPKNDEEKQYFKTECSASSSGFLRLSPGDRLVVFAVNHATGYAGMSTVTVPAVNRDARAADGTCPADANGLLQIQEGTQTLAISHCTQQELGILANVDLYPPEIDVRVQRRAQDEGLAQIAKKHLIRTGGAGTTRDDYLQVLTHWRVRRGKHVAADGGTPSLDAGTPSPDGGPEEDCTRGLLPDGGSCAPGALTDDDGDAGVPLEVYCAELPPTATAKQRATCLKDDEELSDVPAGVPPLAGQIIRVTGSAVEQPAVTTFPVAPGQHTVNVQASLRRVNQDGKRVTVNNLVHANYYLHIVGSRLLERDQDGDGYVSAKEDEAKPAHFEEPSPRGDSPLGLPKQALYLKNVFKRYEADGALVEQYDVAREHEFRILKLEPQKVVAKGDGKPRELSDEKEPTAKERDLSYDFLASLLEPDTAGRAGTLSGDYRVRLGSDQFGIDCPFKLDEATHSITATCGGDYIAEVLSASDLLYIELYLSGNAENVLYRFNFYGLAARRDQLTASLEYTADAAVEADATDGKPATGRPVSRPAVTNFFVEPTQLTSGVVKLCLNESCAPEYKNLLKEATLTLQSSGKYDVEDTGRGTVKQSLQQSVNATVSGARRFKLPLPAHLASMPGSANVPVPVYLVLEPVAPSTERVVMALGKPQGSYNGANARAVGQEVVAGVNVTDGHLAFEHPDFEVPFLNGSFGFKRIYNNQNNQPTHLGIGWTHNFDGWVFEEKVGRYVVVIGGQGFAFPNCEKDPEPAHEGSIKPCTLTDNTHGFELRVIAPMEVAGGGQPDDQVQLKTQDGWTFEFNRPVKGPREEGQRKWMLTRFSDSHGRTEGDVGWTKLGYEGDTDRLSTVTRTSDTGSLVLAFSYEDVDTEDEELPDAISLLARDKDFKWMKSVTLTGGAGGSYTVKFKHDSVGNLKRAARSPGTPFQIYEYDYWPPALSLGATEKFEALNELATARVIYGVTEDAHEPSHWRAAYWRSTESAPYRHIKAHEMVSGVTETGMQGERISINYTSSNQRVVTRPDGVVLTLALNESGNMRGKASPAGTEKTFWGSDSRGGPVFPTTQGTATGRETELTPGPRLLLEKVELTKTPTGSKPVKGLENGGTLVQYTLDHRFGVPSGSTLKMGGGTASVSSPHGDKGDLQSLSVTNEAGTHALFQNAQYDADGLQLSYTDAQGREVQLQDFNALGQAQRMVTTLATATTGLASVTRVFSYDPYGRLLRWDDEETGAYETFTYDGVERPLTHVVSGTPPQSRTYVYEDTENALTVTETLTKSSEGTNAPYTRVRNYNDGRLESESVPVGNPTVTVSRTYTYEHGRLKSSTDEENIERNYHYDLAGRLEWVTADGVEEVRYTLDADGNPYYVTDALGLKTTIAYDGLGRPVFWDWGDGDAEEVQLDAQGNPIRRMLGNAGQHALSFSFLDPSGNPQSTDSESANGGVHEERRYDAAGRLTSREDEDLGLSETYEYGDVQGRPTKYTRTVQSSTVALQLTETRTYDDAQHLVTVVRDIETGTGTRSETEKHTLDTAGRALKVERKVDGQDAVDRFEYTERGDVWRHTSPTNAITQRLYDPQGNLVKVVDAEGHSTTYELDKKGRVHVQKGPHSGYVCTYEYDVVDRLSSKVVSAYGTTPATSWTYAYEPATHEVVETANLGDDKTIVTRRRMNARGKVVKELVSGEGGSHEIAVLFEGPWPKSITTKEGTGWEASTTYASRDDRGRVLDEVEAWAAGGASYRYATTTAWNKRKATATHVDEAGGRRDERTSQVEVDSLGNMISMTQGDAKDTWLYDAAGALAKQAWAGAPSTTYTYAEGLLKQTVYGAEKTEFAYYPDGQLKRRTDPDGRQEEFDYWQRGMVKQSRYGKPSDFQTTDYTYDANGALLSVTYGVGSPDAQTWNHSRGARGELLGMTQPGAGVFTYAYDGLLRLKKVVPPAGGSAEETFAYDSLGRPTLRTRGGAKWQTTWSAGVGTQVDGNQDTTETLLDGRGRVAREVYQPGTASAPDTDLTAVSYAYTALDQPWKVLETRGTGAVESLYTYDSRRLLEQVQRGGESVSFTYTASGHQKTVTSAAGTATYGYDGLDRLEHVTSPTGVTTLEWEAGGSRLKALKGGGLAERRCYDARGRMTAVLNAGVDVSCDNLDAASALHSRFDYSYDGRGNRLSERYSDAQLAMPEVTEYGYDAADRLTGVRYPNGTSTLYRLAGDGTRLEEKDASGYGGTLKAAGFDAASAQRHWRYGLDARGGLEGVYDELQGGLRLATYATDAAGRLRSEVTSAGRKDYGWDAAGRLARVTVQPAVAGQGDNLTATYAYAWDGTRVRRTVGDQTTGYVWAGEQLVEERLAGQPALLYAHADGLAISVGNERIAHDGLGSAVGRVGSTDTWHRYDAWGGYRTEKSHWKVPGSAQASLGFTGHAFDVDAGLVYAQQRWYAPQLGRFLSEDPAFGGLENPTSLNPFSYGNGNPTTYVDPDGQAGILGAAVGGALGFVGGCVYGALAVNRKGACLAYGGLYATTGAIAGATFGIGLALMGVEGGAVLTTSTFFSATGAKIAVAGGAAGLTGGMAAGYATSESTSRWGALRDGGRAALEGGVSGLVTAPVLALAASYGALAVIGTTVTLDATEQGIAIATGLQPGGYDPYRTLSAGIMAGVGEATPHMARAVRTAGSATRGWVGKSRGWRSAIEYTERFVQTKDAAGPIDPVVDNDVLVRAWEYEYKNLHDPERLAALELLQNPDFLWVVTPTTYKEFTRVTNKAHRKARTRFLKKFPNLTVLNNPLAGTIRNGARFVEVFTKLRAVANKSSPGLGDRPNSTKKHTHFNDIVSTAFAEEIGIPFVTADKAFSQGFMKNHGRKIGAKVYHYMIDIAQIKNP